MDRAFGAGSGIGSAVNLGDGLRGGPGQVSTQLAAPDLLGTKEAISLVDRFQLQQRVGSQSMQPIGRDQGEQIVRAIKDNDGNLKRIEATLNRMGFPVTAGFLHDHIADGPDPEAVAWPRLSGCGH
jgi:hypothetical protein